MSHLLTDYDAGGGFFPLARMFGKVRFSSQHPFFFFFKVEIKLRIPIPLRRPESVHSGSVSGDDCGRVFPDELRVSLFAW